MSDWLASLTKIVNTIDDFVWGIPLIVAIFATGIILSIFLRFRHLLNLGRAFGYVFHQNDDHHGEVSAFGALCTALSATIGTGNIVGVATAITTGGPGALFWMEVAALFGMATKYAESLLAVKYREIAPDGRVLGGPFYYIERGLGPKWKPLAVLFSVFGVGVGLLGIGTLTQVHGIVAAAQRETGFRHDIFCFGIAD
jgi:AGCS family alanine or glycine:cation symporter